ncbi:Hypothetical predicted protein [Olea europaea subsp. europaea]|uniref:Pentatricopeptide repeat-containing protein n=1 Tax=Olea europaea subsp. europaea TaxID=158383 RepID=A0A8S0RYZ6_OLEEU|nr:Hypothetical predicted protein [Olea europaea subsp. europaea]
MASRIARRGFSLEEKIDDAVVLLDKIIGMGFQPNVTAWTTMIIWLSRSKNAEVALRFYREVGNSEGRSDLRFKHYFIFYATLIHGLCKEGLVDKGKQLFLEMKDRDYAETGYIKWTRGGVGGAAGSKEMVAADDEMLGKKEIW